jgi:predicted tellurium resistance membrane protein TerC
MRRRDCSVCAATVNLEVMVAAVVIAMIVMYAAAGPVGAFIAFLVLIGVALVADGFEFHIPRGHGVCRRGRSLQRHGKAQPAASTARLTA